MILHRRSLTSVLLAALIVAIALAFGAARADAAPVQLRNAQSGQMMEVLGDGTVVLRPSKPASFRQKWRRSRSARSASAFATSPRTAA